MLNLLTPKLPAPREEELAKGILEAINMDSYRVEKKAALKIALADKDAEGIQFRCFGQAAENWFNQLTGGREVKDPNGVFVARYFDGPGYCAHQTKTATGADISSYLCAIDRPALK